MKLYPANPLAISVFEQFRWVSDTITLDPESASRIDSLYPHGLSEYLDRKSLEFTQAHIMKRFIQERYGLALWINMSYFQNDLFSGIDCWFTANWKRVWANFTNKTQIDFKVARYTEWENNWDRDIEYRTPNRKVSQVKGTVWKIIIWIPSSTREYSHMVISSCGTIQELEEFIRIDSIPGIENIQLAPLNTKWKNWLTRVTQPPSLQ